MPGFIRRHTLAVLTIVAFASFNSQAQEAGPGAAFRDNPVWTVSDGALTAPETAEGRRLTTKATLADSVTRFEYRSPAGANARLILMGRYGFDLPGNGEWQSVAVRFRAPRFDAGFTKLQFAFALDVSIGASSQRSVIFENPSSDAIWGGEDKRGPAFIVVQQGAFAVRNASHQPADFTQIVVPKNNGDATNEAQLKDLVALGKETFTQVGCEACHRVEPNDAAVSSGPNLYGLFRAEARTREVVEGGEGHRFQVRANRPYLHQSVREPAEQLAVSESGANQGQPYLPVMPAFPKDVLTDAQIDAIGDYLATLNPWHDRGPITKLATLEPQAPYDPLQDGLQWLVGDSVRLQRGPMNGVSGRSIHVGNPSGINYTFDPRLLAIVKIWQGGFLDMSGELTNRGGRGLALGHDSREISFGERAYLLAPLNAAGAPVDFTFKEAKYGDSAALKTALYNKEDHLALLAKADAKFLGYRRDSKNKTAAPEFRYRVGKNLISSTTTIAANGAVVIRIAGEFETPQSFSLNPALLSGANATAGRLDGDRWTLPAGKIVADLRGTLSVADKPWRPAASAFSYQRQKLETAAATAKLPAGYSIENYYAPKDNYGRDQLFEALGVAVAKDGTVVVATRNAGIWRLANGEWRLFAEGLFDSLGVIVEDGKGLTVVAGQKAELTRISDVNGDGLADRYDTLYDAFAYHGNYHTYLHGPVKGGDGAYYFALNLAHDGSGAAYMGGGTVMGTYGGFDGWAFRVEPNGNGAPFARGLRSPAGMGAGPDGRVWYADNQGDFVATSKLFVVQMDKFYGHPAGLVDLPGMTPDSPGIKYDVVANSREKAVVLFPHNRVANSPGNPVWDSSRGRFGPYASQMLIGDQTQSNLLRVTLQKVGAQEQGAVMPFFEGLESGVMRPVFLRDGSLLLGQTGRGWQAKGGKVASLQHVRWDGKTVAPGIKSVEATSNGFKVNFTQPLGSGVSESILRSALALDSWTYRDAPDYGSEELGKRGENITALAVSADRRSVTVTLASTEVPVVHPRQTARVYHVKLAAATLFDANAPGELHAYYTLYAFPQK